jgi:hypothetical protein
VSREAVERFLGIQPGQAEHLCAGLAGNSLCVFLVRLIVELARSGKNCGRVDSEHTGPQQDHFRTRI